MKLSQFTRELREEWRNSIAKANKFMELTDKIAKAQEIKEVKEYIQKHPNYKIKDIQRLLLRGYSYTYKLLESIGER